jgi:archaemetzincin
MSILFWQILAIILLVALIISLKARSELAKEKDRRDEEQSDMNEKLYVVPLDEGTRRYGGWLLNELCKRFTLKPQSGIVSRLPEESFNQKQNQYYANTILSKLEMLKGSDFELILALTEEDLFIPNKNFVMGQANSASRTAIVSTFRIKPEFYGLPEDDNLLKARLLNLASHEVGHMLGLKNCKNENCQMYVADSLVDLDNRPESFCADCILDLTLPTKVNI